MSTWAIVVAAGRGERFGERKQYQPLGGQRVLDWAVRSARRHCDGVVLVVPADAVERPEPGVDAVVAGGATRSASVRNGLAAVPDDVDVIVVHDAARPVPAPGVWERVLSAVASGAAAAVPGVPVTDTLRTVDGGTVDRSAFVAVQTPQAFAATALRSAHASRGEASDDASLVEAAGGRVEVVEGDPINLKITTTADLALAEHLCR
ncbi:MAG: 2-C-methyl-D-erythritol 4-phosphate cytidylyltransferase [Acidimicrobiales bacterium]|nr:2-C-methyl-D-erythritol 4-phosphate cytidylyltransferase [Acidimicrobiales bacterium]